MTLARLLRRKHCSVRASTHPATSHATSSPSRQHSTPTSSMSSTVCRSYSPPQGADLSPVRHNAHRHAGRQRHGRSSCSPSPARPTCADGLPFLRRHRNSPLRTLGGAKHPIPAKGHRASLELSAHSMTSLLSTRRRCSSSPRSRVSPVPCQGGVLVATDDLACPGRRVLIRRP